MEEAVAIARAKVARAAAALVGSPASTGGSSSRPLVRRRPPAVRVRPGGVEPAMASTIRVYGRLHPSSVPTSPRKENLNAKN